MKKHVLLTLWAIVAINLSPAFTQTLLEENFDYPADDSLSRHNWTAYSGADKEPIKVANFGLSFPGYALSNKGNAALINPQNATAEDLSHSFTSTNTSSVYASFMLQATDASGSTTGYDIHFNAGTAVACVGIRKIAGKLKFALAKRSSGTFTIANTDYQLNTTYLVVLKYTFNPSTNTDDEVSLYIFDSTAPQSEPSTPVIGPLSVDADAVSNQLKEICLRQFSTAQNIIIDGIKVSKTWSDITLPITLLNFSAARTENTVLLIWQTAMELNNAYYTIERSVDGSKFEAIGKLDGSGTTTTINTYQFKDESAPTATLYYRLQQTDVDGQCTYSKIIYSTEIVNSLQLESFKQTETGFEAFIHTDQSIPILLTISNACGIIHYQEALVLQAGENRIQDLITLPKNHLSIINLLTDTKKITHKHINN